VTGADFKRWLAFGSGIGIQITGPHGSESLEIVAVRVRPSGARVVGSLTIPDFPHQPASVWGTEYAAFLRKLDLRYVAATVILPRQDVIVRPVPLLGVSSKDLPAAVEFQMDGLHPYSEDDVTSSWSRLHSHSTVLVAIARRAAIDRYATFFAEAGVKLGAFTCSAAAIYSALRLFGPPPAAEILASDHHDGRVEFYGESPSRSLFSASFDVGENESEDSRATALARAELRVDPATEPKPLEEVLAGAPALPFAAALCSACPRLALKLNLLPIARRQTGSRAMWIVSGAAAALVLVAAVALVAVPVIEKRRYEKTLEGEIRKIEKRAGRAAQVDKESDAVRRRTLMLDDFRRRAKTDMDVLAELTRILPPPTWVNSLEITRNQVMITGEADKAEPLLKTLDASPLFEASEFIGAPIHSPTGEIFRIRTNRETGR
jgi:Tfp pilus assembly protein PilN